MVRQEVGKGGKTKLVELLKELKLVPPCPGKITINVTENQTISSIEVLAVIR